MTTRKREFTTVNNVLDMKKPQSKGSFQKYLIKKYVKDGCVNWPRDMVAARRLLDIFPDFLFWESLKDKPEFSSLVCLHTEKSLSFFHRQWKIFSLQLKENKPIVLSDEKFGQDTIVQHKPKSVLDFIGD